MEQKPYQIICGSSKDIAKFEEQVSTAVQAGYELVDDLITQPITKADGQVEILFYQPVLLEYELDLLEEGDEEYEEESEEEFLTS